MESNAAVTTVHKPLNSPPPTQSPIAKEQTLPLKWLQASKTNPRKQFDGPDFDELVASIQRQGVIVPLIVRPVALGPKFLGEELRYEVIAGERRYRAATKLGLLDVPVRVMDLNDEETLEVQIVENLQRKDVQPIEEAQGFAALLDSMAKADPKRPRTKLAEDIAVRLGKSASHVRGRIKLLELVPEIRTILEKGVIEASHADLLVRLNSEQQKEMYEEYWAPDAPDYHKENPPSVRALKSEIESNYQPLKQAPFKQEDTKYGQACVGCEHNSATDGGDKKKAVCANQECFDAKVKQFVQIESAAMKTKFGADLIKVCKSSYSAPKGALSSEHWKKAAPKSCDHIVPALVVDYDLKPEGVITVCADKKCKTHFPAGANGSSSYSSPAAEAERKRKAAEEEARRKVELAGGVAIFEAILGKVKAVTQPEFELIVDRLTDNLDICDEGEIALCRILGIQRPATTDYKWFKGALKKASAKMSLDLKAKLLVGVVLLEGIEEDSYGTFTREDLEAVAKKYSLDPKAITAKAEAAAKNPAPQTSAKSSPTSPKAPAAVKKSSPKKAKASSKKGGRK